MGDAPRIRQIVTNMLSNAVKFTPEGQVRFIAEVQPIDATRCEVVLEVSDTGIGMDEATCARIFQPFEQADPSVSRTVGGTGLGLSIVHSLCELMGGEVTVRSELGRGSVFCATLPLSYVVGESPDSGPGALEDSADGAPAWIIAEVPSGVELLQRRLAAARALTISQGLIRVRDRPTVTRSERTSRTPCTPRQHARIDGVILLIDAALGGDLAAARSLGVKFYVAPASAPRPRRATLSRVPPARPCLHP